MPRLLVNGSDGCQLRGKQTAADCRGRVVDLLKPNIGG